MPAYIDPAWEYFVPCDEVADLFRTTGALPRMSLLAQVAGEREFAAGYNLGFRLGSGNPNGNFQFRLARPKAPPREAPRQRVCPSCGELFYPRRPAQKHCGDRCYGRPGRVRELPESLACGGCGKPFRPAQATQTLCGPSCRGKAGAAARNPKQDAAKEDFRRRYEAGEKVADAAAALGVSLPTVKRWRREMGLAARPAGNHSRRAG